MCIIIILTELTHWTLGDLTASYRLVSSDLVRQRYLLNARGPYDE